MNDNESLGLVYDYSLHELQRAKYEDYTVYNSSINSLVTSEWVMSNLNFKLEVLKLFTLWFFVW